MNGLTVVLIAVFSAGGAAAIGAFAKGISGWRAGVSRKEARAISNLEKYRDEADLRANEADHRASYYQDLAEYWRTCYGDAVHKIRVDWDPAQIPPHGPPPVFVPLPRPASKAVVKASDDE